MSTESKTSTPTMQYLIKCGDVVWQEIDGFRRPVTRAAGCGWRGYRAAPKDRATSQSCPRCYGPVWAPTPRVGR